MNDPKDKLPPPTLYMSNVLINGQDYHNVVFVATEHDSVFAYDANDGTLLWRASIGQDYQGSSVP